MGVCNNLDIQKTVLFLFSPKSAIVEISLPSKLAWKAQHKAFCIQNTLQRLLLLCIL